MIDNPNPAKTPISKSPVRPARIFGSTLVRTNPVPPPLAPPDYGWLPDDSDTQVSCPDGDVPFSWTNPLNISNKKYQFIRRAIREINE